MINESPFTDTDESIWADVGLMRKMRRQLKSLLYCAPDHEWLGLTPLKCHVLVCGYPRAGTTLLQAMLERGWPNARRFKGEMLGWRAAAYCWRNHEMMISKTPYDVFYLHRLKSFYRNRRAKLKPIMLIRDPRDVMTSFHEMTGPDRYFLDPIEWHAWHKSVDNYRHDAGVLTIQYERLVADPASVQAKIEHFIQSVSTASFSEFHSFLPRGFDTRALNGVRPIDTDNVSRWSAPEHKQRINDILRLLPDLPEVLMDLGYESDCKWADAYLANRRVAG